MKSPGLCSEAALPQGTPICGGFGGFLPRVGPSVVLLFLGSRFFIVPNLVIVLVEVGGRPLEVNAGCGWRRVPEYLLQSVYSHAFLDALDGEAVS